MCLGYVLYQSPMCTVQQRIIPQIMELLNIISAFVIGFDLDPKSSLRMAYFFLTKHARIVSSILIPT